MKTREIEAWGNIKQLEKVMSESFARSLCAEQVYFYNQKTPHYNAKAIIKIEIPEKEITLTETQFDEAVTYWREHTSHLGPSADLLKQKLFNKE